MLSLQAVFTVTVPKGVEGKGRFLTPSRAVPTFKLHRVLSSGTNFVLHVAEGCAEQNFLG